MTKLTDKKIKSCVPISGEYINRVYYPDGALKSEIAYKNGLLHGKSKHYHPNGTLHAEEEYRLGNRHGTRHIYYPHGGPRLVTNYRSNSKHGEERRYSKKGMLVWSHHHVAKSPWKWHGLRVTYYPNGAIKQEINYSEDELHGYMREYFEEGGVWREVTYRWGKRHGMERIYASAGKLEAEILYKDGRRIWKKVYQDGILQNQEEYEDDIQVCHEARGGVKYVIQYKDGKPHGDALFCLGANRWEYRVKYEEGEIVEGHPCGLYRRFWLRPIESEKFEDGWLKRYNKSGVLLSKIPCKEGVFDGVEQFLRKGSRIVREVTYKRSRIHGLIKTYHPNGNIQDEVFCAGERKIGEYRIYDEEGLLLQMGSRGASGKLHGVQKRYLRGVLVAEDVYVHGCRHGVQKRYYPNSVLQSEVSYKDGVRDGGAKKYREDGKKVYDERYSDGELWVFDGAVRKCFVDVGDEAREGRVEEEGDEKRILHYYHDGSLKLEKIVYQRERSEHIRFYYPNGKLKYEMTYSAPRIKHGVERYYHADGSLCIETPYENGRINGVRKYYSPDGEVELEVGYKDGELERGEGDLRVMGALMKE